ncbi:MAG: ABC transporter permease [Desulfobacterales bacterium]
MIYCTMGKKRHYLHFFTSCISFAVILIIWALMTALFKWNEVVFPGPAQTVKSMWELIRSGVLLKHTAASLFRVTSGFYLAVLFGIPLGIILGRLKVARQFLNPVIHFLRPISPLAWIPFAMLWFGIGDKPAVFLIFLSSFFPLVVSTMSAVSQIDPVYFCVAANFNLSRTERVQKIIFPAILPSIVTSLRISVGVAWLVVVAAEMIAVKSGLGYLILDSRNGLRMDYVVSAMIVIGFIGLILDYVMKRLEKIETVYWGTVR